MFERECTRLGIEKDVDKIETLRLFLEDSCTDWYSGILVELTIESEWAQWRQRLCEAYADKGWLPTMHALSYKYVASSLLDYAVRKRNLLAQMPAFTAIYLIAAGLPSFVRNRIDKEKLKTVGNLFSEIRGLEYLVKKVERKTVANQEKPKDGATIRKSCTICEKRGKNNRFHPEHSCWYKKNTNERKKPELVKHVNNTELEVELNDFDQKN